MNLETLMRFGEESNQVKVGRMAQPVRLVVDSCRLRLQAKSFSRALADSFTRDVVLLIVGAR
jgi:hypothetical protein